MRLQFDAAAPAGSVRVIEMVAQSAGFSQSAALPLTPGTAGALHLAAGHDSIPVHKADGSAQLRLAATNSSSFTCNGVQLRFLMPDRIAGAQSWSDEPLAEERRRADRRLRSSAGISRRSPRTARRRSGSTFTPAPPSLEQRDPGHVHRRR
ncbi:MAG: hypothetical protein R3F11_32000 [Verrucomicrobiales bacterium]